MEQKMKQETMLIFMEFCAKTESVLICLGTKHSIEFGVTKWYVH